ncbi:MAG: hypothetical protein ACKVPX_10890 [Myxococcaceae bacterium]
MLLASLKAGGGHHALRDSFDAALQIADPQQTRFERVVWDSHHMGLDKFYAWCVHNFTPIQGAIYSLSESRLAVEIATRLSAPLYAEVEAMLRTQSFDTVVSSHLLLSMMFAKAKRQLGAPTEVIGAIPDYGIPSKAFVPQNPLHRPDRLIVMAEDTYAHLVKSRGVPMQDIELSGFLPRTPFRGLADRLRAAGGRTALRATLLRELEQEHPDLARVNPARPTLLFLGGSAWTEKTRPVLESLLALPEFASKLNVVVVCGNNPKFAEALTALTAPYRNFSVLGFVSGESMARIMAVADFPVLGSLAPATMQELFEVGCGPLMLFHFIPGTEPPHVDYIHNTGVGLYEPDAEKMVRLLMQLSGHAPMPEGLRALAAGFADRAASIRSASRARALALGEFLEGAAQNFPTAPQPPPALHPVSV